MRRSKTSLSTDFGQIPLFHFTRYYKLERDQRQRPRKLRVCLAVIETVLMLVRVVSRSFEAVSRSFIVGVCHRSFNKSRSLSSWHGKVLLRSIFTFQERKETNLCAQGEGEVPRSGFSERSKEARCFSPSVKKIRSN